MGIIYKKGQWQIEVSLEESYQGSGGGLKIKLYDEWFNESV